MSKRRKAKMAPNTIGQTVASMRAPLPDDVQAIPVPTISVITRSPTPQPQDGSNRQGELKRQRPVDEEDEHWEVVDRQAKKRKKKDKYPEFVWSERSRLGSKIKITDVRDLVLYVQADGTAPQWISVSNRANIQKVVVLMVPGLENAMFDAGVNLGEYNSVNKVPGAGQPQDPQDNYPRALSRENLPKVLAPFAEMFSHMWPIRAPGDDRCLRMYSPVNNFLQAPMPKNKTKETKVWKDEPTRISELLASRDELADNGFMVHPAFGQDGDAPTLPAGWVATRVDKLEDGAVPEAEIEEKSLTAGRQVLAIDCEMCMTGPDEFSLTRISILNWGGDIVMDELVKPERPIVDHLTQYSGITAEMLAPVTTTLADIQKKLLDLITPQTILVGHSLDSDLKAMQLVHPFIADTSLLFPHPRGTPLKQSLKYLSKKYLNREIQKGHGDEGHNSIEDARASLDLVRQKCAKGKLWGMADAQNESLFQRLGRAGVSAADLASLEGNEAAKRQLGKKSAAVDIGNASKGPGAPATYRISCKSDNDVLLGVLRAIKGDTDGAEIPIGGVDFVWARMRELEAHQGWVKNAAATIPAHEGPQKRKSEDDSTINMDNTLEASIKAMGLKDAPRSRLESYLAAATTRLVHIYDSLPPCTALMVLSGSGDPREMARLQELQHVAKAEAKAGIDWDELTVKWNGEMDEALVRAVRYARGGIGFLTIK